MFGYASLASPASAAQTLGRPGRVRRRRPAARLGARLDAGPRAGGSEKTFARADGSMPALLPRAQPRARSATRRRPNGVLIELTEAELDRLDLRELRYDRGRRHRRDRARRRRGHGLRPRDRLPREARAPPPRPPPEDAIIVATYPATIEAAFDALGPGQLDLFRATTAPPPAPLVEGTLVRDEIPPGNPRAW